MPSPAPTPTALVGALRPFEVLRERFHATMFRPGYDQESVDDFLDRVASDLARRWSLVDAGHERAATMPPPRLQLDATALTGQAFPMTKLRQGYRPADVDQLIGQIGATFARLDTYLESVRPAAG